MVEEKKKVSVSGAVIEHLDDKVRLTVSVKIISEEENRSSKIWYEIDSEYEKYLYVDRVDPFVVAILPYCMKNSYDIDVDETTGISVDLLYQLRDVLVPSLKNAENFSMISISAKPIFKSLKKADKVATGMSRGVDAFYTFLKTMQSDVKPDFLALFDTQAYGEFGGDASDEMYEDDLAIVGRLCEDMNQEYASNLKVLSVRSNIQDIFPIEIYYAGSYRDAGAIILFKQLLKLYYYSSSYIIDQFAFSTARHYEAWLLSCLSTEGQRLQLYGAEKRTDKIRFISDYPITYKYLQVCARPLLDGSKNERVVVKNCTCDCWKCIPTAMVLRRANKLEKYKEVFDVDRFIDNEEDMIRFIVDKHNRWEIYNDEVFDEMKKDNYIPKDIEASVYMQSECTNDIPYDRDSRIMYIMDSFIEKKQKGWSLKKHLIDSGFESVGIYGMGRLGKILYNDLGNMVCAEIDRSLEEPYGKTSLRRPDDDLSDLDIIIITTVYDEQLIQHYLLTHGRARKVITFKDLLTE